MDRLQIFLNITGIFFAIYMFGYTSYTMVAGIVSIWNLYRNRLKERMENVLDHFRCGRCGSVYRRIVNTDYFQWTEK